MSADTRQWTCPECGKNVELSIFKLDPLACDECLEKRKRKADASPAADAMKAMPEVAKLGAALVVGLLLGLVVGFAAGRFTAPQPAATHVGSSKSSSSGTSAKPEEAEERPTFDEVPDESTRPGANYRWIKGYTRKDGVKVKGHWAKDSKK